MRVRMWTRALWMNVGTCQWVKKGMKNECFSYLVSRFVDNMGVFSFSARWTGSKRRNSDEENLYVTHWGLGPIFKHGLI